MATATVQNEKPLKVNKSRQKDDYADDEKTTKDEVDLGAKVDDLMATTDEWMQKKEIESDDNLVVFVHGMIGMSDRFYDCHVQLQRRLAQHR